ncbi:diguanylate cyclase domain-containing protein [Citreimonas sp.]|uniref:diguanylate cyclase domain-containing protein n=1 Tax=Citreimonas sp. TaxID=3036715 RepID=UPI0035C81872
MFDGPNHRSFRSQIVAALVLLGVFGAAPVIVVGVHSVARIDDDAAARETMQVSAAIAARFDHLPTEQRSASIWDDAVIAAQAGDVAWIESNLGVWMQTYFGHDLNFVLSPALEPVYAAIGGETRDPAAFAAVAEPVLALARDARATVLAGEVDPAEIAATDHVALPDGPAVVSVVPIVPDTDTVAVAPEAMSFHVAVDMIDAAYVAAVTEGLALREPALVDAAGDRSASVAIEDARGAVVSRLGWTAATPARSLVAALFPALALWLLAGAALVFWLAGTLMRTSQKLQHSEAQSRFLAFHDPLTQLPNRALFDERLDQALARRRTTGLDVTLLVLDLDQFKNVNDTLGHPAGDELIRQVAHRITARLRDSDTAARLGGDEFAIVLDGDMGVQDLFAFCEGLLEDISRPFDLFGNMVQVSGSIGACRARERSAGRAELVRRADIALYQAKRAGRRTHCVFVKEMDVRGPSDTGLDRDPGEGDRAGAA